jgi:hypothetical protein
LFERFSLEQWSILLVLLGHLASMESQMLEIHSQPCVGALEERGKARGTVCSEGGSQFLGLHKSRGRESWRIGIVVGKLVGCGNELGCERHPLLWNHSPILGVIYC